MEVHGISTVAMTTLLLNSAWYNMAKISINCNCFTQIVF